MVVAQLVERSVPTPEIRGSNPVIGKLYLLSTVSMRLKLNKRGRDWTYFKKLGTITSHIFVSMLNLV